MRVFLISIFALAFAAICMGQDPCGAFVDEDLQLCRDWQAAEEQKSALLKQQQDWNNSAATQRLQHYNDLISRWEAKLTEVVDKAKLIEHIQAKIDRYILLRDGYDRKGDPENPGPRDEAAKLGPQISELSQLIGQLKEHLGIPE